MGWFDEQIKNREENDKEALSDAFVEIASSVMKKNLSLSLKSDRLKTNGELERILSFYHIKMQEIPEHITDVNDQLDFLLHPNGIMRRTVKLGEHWYRDAIGVLLGVLVDDDRIVALIPSPMGGYFFYNEEGNKQKINSKNEKLFKTEAICFYRPLPLKKLGIRDLIKYTMGVISGSDIVAFAIASLAVALLGLLMPKLNNIIFSDIVQNGNLKIVLSMTVFLACISISMGFIGAIKSLIMARINTKLSMSVEAAVMMRNLSLSPAFFKDYSTGYLTSLINYVKIFCDTIVSMALSTGFTSLFALIYISQIFEYAPALVVPSLIIIITTMVFSVISALVEMRLARVRMKASAEKNALEYALISGVQKLKLSGSENRAFAKWGRGFARYASVTYNTPLFIKINSALSLAITLIGNIVIYYMAIKSNISIADYYAFNVAYGMVSGAFMSVSKIALSVARIKPIAEIIKPLLEAVPEASEKKPIVSKISGDVELNNIYFRYNEDTPYIIDGLSLKIRPGQYVAIVGPTGCGKSTLIRLLLGFEKPQKGAIYFDGRDITKVDLNSQRSCIGVVLQDGKLFTGDIFSNIAISAPRLTLDEAWDAAEKAGIAEDIRKMPMGMHTMISEGSGGISGGQKQRILIARAIATKSKILILDEATSALDNISQKHIAESLADLKCTRIVIAHRLSTIQQSDRIVVLKDGKIAEDGTYEELISKEGIFAELVSRQRLDL